MSMIKCKQCLDDINTPFGFYIKKDGLCGGCHNAIKSKKTSETLLDLVQKIKEKNSGSYDCIVPCKGTAEDFFVVEKLKENNINPLLVFVNSYFNTNSAWKNFHKLIEVFDVDSRTYNPKIKKYKKIVSYMLSNHQDIFIPYKMLNYSYSKQLAAKLGVRYIVSGEFQELLTVGKFNRENNVQKTRWSMFQHDINVASEQIIGHEIDSFMENTLYDSVNDFENEQVSKIELQD